MSQARANVEPTMTPFSFSFNGGFSFSLTLRRAVLHRDLLNRSSVYSQFFVSISNLTQKLALVTPFGRISSW